MKLRQRKMIVMITLAIGAFAMVGASCRTAGCNGSSKMVGYGTPTAKVLKNNR